MITGSAVIASLAAGEASRRLLTSPLSIAPESGGSPWLR